jgi:predicted nuclease of predicted toxin-antitoxin system
MSLRLYLDVHVRRAVRDGLRLRGVDVLTAQEDGAAALPDPELLDRATALGRVLFTQDEDLLNEANQRQQLGITFAGVVYGHQRSVTVGRCISDLELISKVYEPQDLLNRVEYLPLK